MLSLCLFERYLASQQERLHATARSISNEYRLRSIEQQNSSNKATRQLWDDMGNHISAIQRMAREGDCSSILDYTQSMSEQASRNSSNLPATGNSLLNGLLSQKIDEAKHDHIRFSADLNAAPLCFISDFDLCAILGNALDNSIEACRKNANPTRRFIDITSRFVAGCLIVSTVNSYDGGLTMANGVPKTTKKTIPFHGIGMTSINDSPQKYEAEMSISLNRPEIFNLTLVIPLREAAPEETSVQH